MRVLESAVMCATAINMIDCRRASAINPGNNPSRNRGEVHKQEQDKDPAQDESNYAPENNAHHNDTQTENKITKRNKDEENNKHTHTQ